MPRLSRPRRIQHERVAECLEHRDFQLFLKRPFWEFASDRFLRFAKFFRQQFSPRLPTDQSRRFRQRKFTPILQFSSLSLGDFDLNDLKESLSKIQLPFWVDLSSPYHPDKKRLMTVHDFFKYTEKQGRTFFESLDRDGDGIVTLDDMKYAMKKFKLPEKYAREFLAHARGGKWWVKQITWDEFKALVDERESDVLRAYTTLTVNKRGEIDSEGIKNSLTKLGLPSTEDNAKAMLRAIGSEDDGYVSYTKFRNFAILLPKHTLMKSDPSLIWFESATYVPIGPPRTESDILGTGKMLLTAALAGGLASACSTFVMHPIDTLKTRVQSTVGASTFSILKSVPKIGVQNLFRGIVPATAGSGLSQSLRTCAYEGVFRFLSFFTQGGFEVQLQGLAIGVGTFMACGVRIPCEVLKQRLQIGRHANARQALQVALQTDGPRGLYRGTLALISREVPFYMFGMMFYQMLKKVFRGEMFGGGSGRKLRTWEILTVGALSGALGAIATTPADVVKTRIMSAAAGTVVSPSQILIEILKAEGIPALFKGWLPRAVWIAPVGVMNFAGYELAKQAIMEAEKRKDELEYNFKRLGETNQGNCIHFIET
eukprot:g4918.t1